MTEDDDEFYCGEMGYEVVDLDLFPFLELNEDEKTLSLLP